MDRGEGPACRHDLAQFFLGNGQQARPGPGGVPIAEQLENPVSAILHGKAVDLQVVQFGFQSRPQIRRGAHRRADRIEPEVPVLEVIFHLLVDEPPQVELPQSSCAEGLDGKRAIDHALGGELENHRIQFQRSIGMVGGHEEGMAEGRDGRLDGGIPEGEHQETLPGPNG